MPNYFGKYCHRCPYTASDAHRLHGQCVNPLTMEINSTKNLIVLQSPGEAEWRERKPLASSVPQSAAGRINASLSRLGKKREDFSITNAVQCFPGRGINGRDLKPHDEAQHACQNYLSGDIRAFSFQIIIVFGKIAQKSCERLGYLEDPRFQYLGHPSGGLTNRALDSSLGSACG